MPSDAPLGSAGTGLVAARAWLWHPCLSWTACRLRWRSWGVPPGYAVAQSGWPCGDRMPRGSAMETLTYLREAPHSMTTADHLSMPLGEAIFSLRAIRRLQPDPIPDTDIRDILEAAIRTPNGGNAQAWHFLAVKDPTLRAQLGTLYHEAWWAKRRDAGIQTPEELPPITACPCASPRRSVRPPW